MIYNLQSEIAGLKITEAVKRRLALALRDVVKGPGQIKTYEDANQFIITVKAPQYEGSVCNVKKYPDKLWGGIKHRTKPQSVVFNDEDYSTRFIEYGDQFKGIYEIRFTKDDDGRKQAVCTYFDGEVVDFIKSNALGDTILGENDSVREQLEPRGVIPNYEGRVDPGVDDISVDPVQIVQAVNYCKENVPNTNMEGVPTV